MKKILLGFLILFVGFLFYSALFNNKNIPIKIDQENDFLISTTAPKEIQEIIKTSCYDCHSYQTVYPTYSKYFPISVLINRHIEEGREHANFSDWKNYNKESKSHILQEAIEQIEKGKMPMSSYILLHNNATLNQEKKKLLLSWLQMEKEKI